MSAPVDLAPFKVLIHERCGLGFASAGDDAKLRQAIMTRAQYLQLRADAYFLRLGVSNSEFQELVNLLTINETYFFREPEQLRFVIDRVLPRFVARPSQPSPIRILSAGCSSGEEPYSLAIALQEKYGTAAAEMFSIHAGDIDSAMLEKARRAIFSNGMNTPAFAHSVRCTKVEGHLFQVKPEQERSPCRLPPLELTLPNNSSKFTASTSLAKQYSRSNYVVIKWQSSSLTCHLA